MQKFKINRLNLRNGKDSNEDNTDGQMGKKYTYMKRYNRNRKRNFFQLLLHKQDLWIYA